MASLDLDSLRAFIAVADTSSFSRAGEKVGRSQSAVSLQLARLEKILGKVLVVRRQGRVLGLSDDGRELLRYARQIIALNDAAYRAVAQSRMPSRIRLGIPQDFLTGGFLTLLRKFRAEHDDVDIEVVADVSRRLIDQTHNGVLDLSFFKQIPGQGHGTAVLTQPLTWIGGEIHPAWRNDAPLPLVLFPDGCPTRDRIFDALEKRGVFWRVSYTAASVGDIRLAIEHGVGYSALPKNLLRPDENLPAAPLPPVEDVELAFQMAQNTAPAIRLLADRIAAFVRTQ